jgi:uncharacterized protein HemY
VVTENKKATTEISVVAIVVWSLIRWLVATVPRYPAASQYRNIASWIVADVHVDTP